MKKLLVAGLLSLTVFACQKTVKKAEKAEMYEASELAATMRVMVDFSKSAKQAIAENTVIDSIPSVIWDMATAHGTRDEHLEADFQSMTTPYLEALKGIERGDSQSYYYYKSIDACKSCHGVYCGGPMAIINQLD
ncbi:MAG: hypothetical protein ACI9JN_001792 [Bacteroidia bacterium]|jgi:hypothetical protein